jgi:adenylate cyclase class IV
MANEIEMNFKIIDKDGLLNYLRSLAGEKTQNIKMTYLGKHGEDSFYIRIEEISDENGDKKVLTAKGNFVSTDGINQRKEVSIPIAESPEKYIEFLTLIGMELRDSKSKIRHFFHIDDLDITIDEWNVEELGNRLEIEGVDESKVKEFASKLVQYCDPTPSK